MHSADYVSTHAALEALTRGWMAVPIRGDSKSPHISAWPHLRWDPEQPKILEDAFTTWREEGATNVGLLLGAPSGGLIDVDMDHPKTMRLRDYFLPPTQMRTGRAGRPMSHYWYVVEDLDDLPGTRRHKMPDGQVSVELRSTGAQTIIPPSIHVSGERYRWEGRRWGGARGPAKVPGKVLAMQVAMLGLGCVLIDNWPEQGGRHDAYLALAGGLLRFGQTGVHPFWERNLHVLIRAMAEATHDEDGPDTRETEVMTTTLRALRSGKKAVGFPRLGEMIGVDHAEQVRRMAREVESLAGFSERPSVTVAEPRDGSLTEHLEERQEETDALVSSLPPEERDPLGERVGTWQPVDLEPYLAGEVHVPQPTILRRPDGVGMFYEGRVNALFGQSEAAKSWIALAACMQEMALGARVMYLDFEDEPTFTLARLSAMGVGVDDVRSLFTYVHPEDPISAMQRNRWGSAQETDIGRANTELFSQALDRTDPRLIIVDGMTVLYGLHGLDSNDAVSTDVITTWLKKLCRNGRSTVIVIDHTGKSAIKGSSPIGAHHKVAMVQGSSIQAFPIEQPMPGKRGVVQLVIHKDRPGGIRSKSNEDRPQIGAVVVLDSTEPDITRVEIQVPQQGDVVIDVGAGLDQKERREKKEADRQERERAAAAARDLKEREAQAKRVWLDTLRADLIDLFGGDLDCRLSKSKMLVRLLDSKQDWYTDPARLERGVQIALSELVQERIFLTEGERRWTVYGLRND